MIFNNWKNTTARERRLCLLQPAKFWFCEAGHFILHVINLQTRIHRRCSLAGEKSWVVLSVCQMINYWMQQKGKMNYQHVRGRLCKFTSSLQHVSINNQSHIFLLNLPNNVLSLKALPQYSYWESFLKFLLEMYRLKLSEKILWMFVSTGTFEP